jgi:hypothetical protein
MPRKRAHISLTTKLASALLALGHVPHEHAKLMSAEQIISLFQFHHYPIPSSLGGPDEPWNLQPELIGRHRHITTKDNGTGRSDVTMIARERRIERERTDPKPTRKIAARVNPWPKGRKIQNRGFEKRRKEA